MKELRQAIEQIASDGHRWLLLDMTSVPYVDSAGLGAIITGLNLFRKIEGDLLLTGLQPRISQLLELTNLVEILKIFPSEQAALDSLRTHAQAPSVS
ncbi:MAG: STAS domain-containing protein [Acidobacteriaceae bacterium]|nr:STAS domain-containing protein [Acidobacteriaceae bacterium]